MMRLIFGMLLAIIWAGAGLVASAAFVYAFHLNVVQTLGAGAVIGAVLGFIYGVLTPTPPRRSSSAPPVPIRNRLALETCAWCRGTGLEGRKKSPQTCRVCLGEGRVLTEQPTRRCPRCRGKGRLLGGRRCPVCEGSGLASFQVFERTRKKRAVTKVKKRKNRWGWPIKGT
ncbi:MAG: hypothetical protein KDI62_06445 [Anaerolineae bacterium]|nr:hypothetical protein [Anaerolineae bacterium]MCB0177848.1 hypothetical protein [Anaerolineae bacterium]MCB9103260.1 hypothetical protein [Anaerolineales bacterium]